MENILDLLKKEFPNHKLEIIQKDSNNYGLLVNGKELKVKFVDILAFKKDLKEYHNLDWEKEFVHLLKEYIKEEL